MIILDTSILRNVGLQSSSADLLRTIRTVGVQRVGVPWVVCEELAAQRAVKYRTKYEKATEALEALSACTPWKSPTKLLPFDPDEVRGQCREELLLLAELIPTSRSALAEATFREANVLPPCKVVKDVKTGGRDAAIWLTAVEFAKDNPDETVYFVSSNTGDFGDGSTYQEPMSGDLAGVEDRFVHLTALDSVVDLFAQPDETSSADALERVRQPGVGISAAVLRGAARLYPARMLDEDFVPFGCSLADWGEEHSPAPSAAAGWISIGGGRLVSVDEVSGYRIGDHKWVMATGQWLAGGWVQTGRTGQAARAVSLWKAKILFTLSKDPKSKVAVLRQFPGEPVPDELLPRARDMFPSYQIDSKGAMTKLERSIVNLSDTLRRYPPIDPVALGGDSD